MVGVREELSLSISAVGSPLPPPLTPIIEPLSSQLLGLLGARGLTIRGGGGWRGGREVRRGGRLGRWERE